MVICDDRYADAVGNEADARRSKAKYLHAEAEAVVAEAKARVERLILGQEDV